MSAAIKRRVRKERDTALLTSTGVAVAQGWAKKTGAFKLPTFGLPVNPELAWGGAMLLASLMTRGTKYEKLGNTAFNVGLPLFTVGARTVSASGFDFAAVGGYNAGFRITEDAFDSNAGAYDDGEF